jgi:hypothetical protein
MPKKQLEGLIEATKQSLEIEELKAKAKIKEAEEKLTEAKENREHKWIYLIWSAGAILILVILILQGRW